MNLKDVVCHKNTINRKNVIVRGVINVNGKSEGFLTIVIEPILYKSNFERIP